MKRDSILDAALELMTSEGAAGFSMRKLAAVMGASTGVLYHHFTDKDELLAALAAREYQTLADLVRASPHDPAQPVESICRSFRRYADWLLQRRPYARLVLIDAPESFLQRAAVLRRGIALHSPTFALLVERLQEGMQAGLIRHGETELIAQGLWLTVFGHISRLLLEPDAGAAQEERLLAAMETLLAASLRP